MKYKYALLVLGLFLCTQAKADSVTNLSGTIKEPGVKVDYSYNVQTIDYPTFVLDVLNGSVVIKDGRIHCHPCGETIINNYYIFGYNETIILDSWLNWNLMADANHVWLVDPPSPTKSTPEPSTGLLTLLGLAFLRRRK